MKSKLIAVLSAALLASGCAAQKDVELDHNNLAGIHRIAVVGPADPVPVAVTTESEMHAQQAVMAASAVPLLGLIGGAVMGGVAGAVSSEIARETSEPLAKKVEEEHYKLGEATQLSLVDALKHANYDAAPVAFVRPNANRWPENYEGLADPADMVLDASASAMCSNVGSGDKPPHFRPVLAINIRLFRVADHAVVMEKHFILDDAIAMTDVYHVRGETQFDIPDYDALKGMSGSAWMASKPQYLC